MKGCIYMAPFSCNMLNDQFAPSGVEAYILPHINYMGMCRCIKPFCQEQGIGNMMFYVKNRVLNLSKFRIKSFAKAQFRNRCCFVKA